MNVPADWIHLATVSALSVPHINVTRHQGPNILSRRFGELCAGLLTGRSMEPGNGRCVKQCHFYNPLGGVNIPPVVKLGRVYYCFI